MQSAESLIPAQKRLLERLNQLGVFRAQRLKDAFIAVPRHLFIQSFYRRDRSGRWVLVERPSTGVTERWLSVVYQDRALVTQLDQRGNPASSSSQPSAMAQMLAELDVQPGEQVLEIGTGTGYNAGLLAYLTGDPHLVTSIEIDHHVAWQAQEALSQVLGPGVLVHTGNGLEGYAPRAPYDRLIATGSYPFVPFAWLEQLKPGGVLVMNLRGELGGGFLRLQKAEPGYAAHGTFFSIPGVQFLALAEEHDLAANNSMLLQGYQTRPLVEQATFSEKDFAPALLEDPHFRCFLQWRFPGGLILWIQPNPAAPLSPRLVDVTENTMLSLDPIERPGSWRVEVRGSYALWTTLLHIAQYWAQLGRPESTDCTLDIDEAGQQEVILSGASAIGVLPPRWIIHPPR